MNDWKEARLFYLKLLKEPFYTKQYLYSNLYMLRKTFNNDSINKKFIKALEIYLNEINIEKNIMKYILKNKKYIYFSDAMFVVNFLKGHFEERNKYLLELKSNFKEAINCGLESKCFLPRNPLITYKKQDLDFCDQILNGKTIANILEFLEIKGIFSYDNLINIYLNAKKFNGNDNIWYGVFDLGNDEELPKLILPEITEVKDLFDTIYCFIELACLLKNKYLEVYINTIKNNDIVFTDANNQPFDNEEILKGLEEDFITNDEINALASYYQYFYMSIYDLDNAIDKSSEVNFLLEQNVSSFDDAINKLKKTKKLKL